MQNIGNASENKRTTTQNNFVHIKLVISKSNGNHKPKNYNGHTHKKKQYKHNTKDREQIIREDKKKRKRRNKIQSNNPEQLTKWQ